MGAIDRFYQFFSLRIDDRSSIGMHQNQNFKTNSFGFDGFGSAACLIIKQCYEINERENFIYFAVDIVIFGMNVYSIGLSKSRIRFISLSLSESLV